MRERRQTSHVEIQIIYVATPPSRMWNTDFPRGPVVKTSPSNAGGVGSTPGQGAQIPHASMAKTKKHKTEAIL